MNSKKGEIVLLVHMPCEGEASRNIEQTGIIIIHYYYFVLSIQLFALLSLMVIFEFNLFYGSEYASMCNMTFCTILEEDQNITKKLGITPIFTIRKVSAHLRWHCARKQFQVVIPFAIRVMPVS